MAGLFYKERESPANGGTLPFLFIKCAVRIYEYFNFFTVIYVEVKIPASITTVASAAPM